MFAIDIQQHFAANIHDIFSTLSDHETFGRIVGANIQRVSEGKPPYINGLGSVRKISIFPGMTFEETITGFLPDQFIEYRVTKGSPIKHHVGQLVFSTAAQGGTLLAYRIEFVPKLNVPGWGNVLKKAIESPIRKGLAGYAASLRQTQ